MGHLPSWLILFACAKVIKKPKSFHQNIIKNILIKFLKIMHYQLIAKHSPWLTVVLIWTIFLTLLGVALSVSLGVQHGNQSKKLAFTLCSKVWAISNWFLFQCLSLVPWLDILKGEQQLRSLLVWWQEIQHCLYFIRYYNLFINPTLNI